MTPVSHTAPVQGAPKDPTVAHIQAVFELANRRTQLSSQDFRGRLAGLVLRFRETR